MNHVLRYNTLHHILVQITDSASAKLIRDINSINEENKIPAFHNEGTKINFNKSKNLNKIIITNYVKHIVIKH